MARGMKATNGDGGGKSTKKKQGCSSKQVSDETEEEETEQGEAEAETEQGEEEEQVEIWDLVRLIQQDSGDKACCCRTKNCTNEARVVWASKLNLKDEWPLCLACQEKDFNGFPDDFSLPPEFDDNDRPFEGTTGSDKKDTSNNNAKDNSSTAASDKEDADAANDDGGYDSGDDEEEEQWDIKKIMSIHDVTNCPVLCSTEGCNLPAAVILVSTLKPTEKWYSCLPCQVCSDLTLSTQCIQSISHTTIFLLSLFFCFILCAWLQEDDFGGWPPVEELPLKYMTEEHKKALITHCSDRADVAMPDFDPAKAPAASPMQNESSLHNSHPTVTAAAAATTVTPLPGQSSMKTTTTIMETAQQPADVDGGGGAKITPAERAKKPPAKPSKKDMETHAKWQKEAAAMGGKDARIVVSKPKAKTLIFELLRDEFAPMNITTINNVRVLKRDATYLLETTVTLSHQTFPC